MQFERFMSMDGLSVRDSGEGRTIYGVVVPYNRETMVNDGFGAYRESFAPGAFARSIAERGSKVKLFINHEKQRLPVGRAMSLEDRSDGLYGEFLMAATGRGQEALSLVKDGIVDSFSVGFRGVSPDHAEVRQLAAAGKPVVRTEAAIWEASLVGMPAYEDALVGGIRSDLGQLDPTELRSYLASLTPELRALTLETLQALADGMTSSMGDDDLADGPPDRASGMAVESNPHRAQRHQFLRRLALS